MPSAVIPSDPISAEDILPHPVQHAQKPKLITAKIRPVNVDDSSVVQSSSESNRLPSSPAVPHQEVDLVLEFFTAEMMSAHDELVKRTRALEEANHRLQEIDQLKTRLVGDVAHELRAPLASILLKLDLIERDKEDHREKHLNDVRRQVRRLGHMIENILDLTRIYMSNPADRFKDIDLNDLLAQTVKAHENTARTAGLKLEWLPSVVPLSVHGEAEQLERVFENLINNAVKYTRTGSISVSSQWDIKHTSVCVTVRDTGIGIAQEDMPRLFSRFHRGKLSEEANIPGTGLGLAIVKEIVDLHGGTIDISSEPGVGTTARVLLPGRC